MSVTAGLGCVMPDPLVATARIRLLSPSLEDEPERERLALDPVFVTCVCRLDRLVGG